MATPLKTLFVVGRNPLSANLRPGAHHFSLFRSTHHLLRSRRSICLDSCLREFDANESSFVGFRSAAHTTPPPSERACGGQRHCRAESDRKTSTGGGCLEGRCPDLSGADACGGRAFCDLLCRDRVVLSLDGESAVISIEDHTKIAGSNVFLGDLGGFARDAFAFGVTVLPITVGPCGISRKDA